MWHLPADLTQVVAPSFRSTHHRHCTRFRTARKAGGSLACARCWDVLHSHGTAEEHTDQSYVVRAHTPLAARATISPRARLAVSLMRPLRYPALHAPLTGASCNSQD